MLKRLLMVFALSISALAANAEINTRNLTDAQVANLKAEAAKLEAENENQKVNPKTMSPEILSNAASWGTQAATAAEGFAKAIGIAAKELGVTVNDFLQTDAGKLTAALIVWKVAGAAFLKIIYMLLFVSVGMTVARILYLRLFTKGYEKVEYSRFWGMFTGTKLVRVPKSISELNDGGEWLTLWIILAIIATTMLIGFVAF